MLSEQARVSPVANVVTAALCLALSGSNNLAAADLAELLSAWGLCS